MPALRGLRREVMQALPMTRRARMIKAHVRMVQAKPMRGTRRVTIIYGILSAGEIKGAVCCRAYRKDDTAEGCTAGNDAKCQRATLQEPADAAVHSCEGGAYEISVGTSFGRSMLGVLETYQEKRAYCSPGVSTRPAIKTTGSTGWIARPS